MIWRERCLRVLLYSIIFIVLAGIIKPQPVDPVVRVKTDDERFWVVKTHYVSNVDMVLMGDSRLYRGISPKVMKDILKGYRILNFGYSSGGLNHTMYREAEKRLNDERYIKIIVLAVTPYSLTLESAENKHFLQEESRPKEDIYQRLYINPSLKYFEPTTPYTIILALLGKREFPSEFYYQEFYDDGWVASWIIPDNPNKALANYRKQFKNIKVSPDLVDDLMNQTTDWVRRNIKVFGYRNPTTRAMVELEDELSGFDERSFVKRFTDAGGVWFSFPLERYHSYDGSHLHKDSAIQLSQDLAIKIKASLNSEVEKLRQ